MAFLKYFKNLKTENLKLSQNMVSGDNYKKEIVNYLKENLGTESFKDGFKNYSFKSFVENLHIDIKNEKGASS